MALIKIAENTRTYDALPEGKYEVIVDKFDEPVMVDGAESSRIMFSVRSDLNSNFKNRKLFTNVKANDKFTWLINGLSKAIGIPTNTEFETLSDFLNEIKGKPLIVKIKHRPNPKDASKPYVNVVDFYPTSTPISTTTDDNTII
jgi:hypothetical protein